VYEDHGDQRDRFEVFAVHDKTVKSFAELDEKLPPIKERFWQNRDLPFPVLLDATGETEKLYGIRSHPTGLLLDPDGKLVGEARAADLEAKLPPLPAAKKWARHRDIQKNVFWTFEPSEYSLSKLADTLKRHASCDTELDVEAIKACGLTPEAPLPGVLCGVNVTLRSIDELLLAPHGLGVIPAADGKKLLITKRSPTKEAASYFQKSHARELDARLDRGPSAAGQSEARPLEIKDQDLLAAVKLIGREFDLPVALDAKAMCTKTLDPTAKVNGSIGPGNLRKALTKMLDPLGLTVEVRHEAVLVMPKK
jgi:hypothetical protein